MDKRKITVGIFVVVAAALFTGGLFLIGNQHKAFRRHVEFYTEFANLDGIAKGAKLRVAGMDGGQVTDIQIPDRPSAKFRLHLQVEDKLHGLIRADSLVTIETSGIVGDKYLLIHEGSDQAAEAAEKTTLHSKEPFEIADMIEKASGILNKAGGTITDVQGKLDGALDAVTKTVNNTNGVVTDIRRGRGTAGLLLEDKATAAEVKQAIGNGQQATANINQATVKVNDLLTDLQSRNLPQKAGVTMDNVQASSEQAKQASLQINQASQRINQTTQQLNQTLTQALGEDQFGENAASNLRQSLSNVNQATGNLADDSEALKHEFFFRGFFKKRGYDTLDNLPVEKYRQDLILTKDSKQREWLAASALFQTAPDGTETLSLDGRQQLDLLVARLPNVYGAPLILEGYSAQGSPSDRLVLSRQRAVLVLKYLQLHFRLESKDLGIVALSSTPPRSAGRPTWDGICLVLLTPRK